MGNPYVLVLLEKNSNSYTEMYRCIMDAFITIIPATFLKKVAAVNSLEAVSLNHYRTRSTCTYG